MRVTCETFEDFLENLKSLDPDQTLFSDVIRLSISHRDKSAASHRVIVQCSTLVQMSEAEFILDFGEDCGLDYFDGQGEHPGTDRANSIKDALKKLADDLGWKILPGIIGV